MSIYISFHPIDTLFAAELIAYLKNSGYSLTLFSSSCHENIESTLSKNDVIITILRPEYIKSSIYSRLSEQLTVNTAILPVLRAPIAIEDWYDKATLVPVIDCSSCDDDQSRFNMDRLKNLLATHAENPKATEPNTKENYMNHLEVALQEGYFPINSLEKLNYKCDSTAKNPVYSLLAELPFKVFTSNEGEISFENYSLKKTHYLEYIIKDYRSFTLICDYLDSLLITTFMVDLVRERFINSSGKTPMPVLLDLENWDTETPWDEWLGRQVNSSDLSPENITINDLVIYVYGFEKSPLKAGQFRSRFKLWWHGSPPAPPLVMVCTYLDDSVDDTEFIVRPVPYDLARLKQACTEYSNRPFARFILSSGEHDEGFRLLMYFLEDPTFAAILLSVRFEQCVDFTKQTLHDFFRAFVDNLWGFEKTEEDLDFPEVNSALSKIATMVTEYQKSFITYDEALSFFRSESLLEKCIDRGLFLFKNKKLRFSILALQNYFAALALVQNGISTQLPALTLNPHYGRVPQRWDKSVILSSHIVTSSDEVLIDIANLDPILALRCFISGIPLNKTSYLYVIDKNLEALISVGDFRLNFASLLYKIDPVAAKAIFVEIMRSALWSIRVDAYSLYLELDKSIMPGLAESLTEINDHTRIKVSHALKRIGSNALPTLFKLLQHDNVDIRLNVIRAASELKDKACVPALVKMLRDNNPLVVMQAISALGTLQDIHSVPYLVKYLQHRHRGIRQNIISSLIKIQNKQPDLFLKIVRKIDAPSRRLLAVYLSSSQKNNLLDFLLALSYDEDVDVKIAAIEGLATIAEPRVISRLVECLEDMSKSRLYKARVNEIVSKILSNVSGYRDVKIITDKSDDDTNTKNALNSSQIVKSRLLSVKEQRPKPINSAENTNVHSEQSNANFSILKADDLLSEGDAYVSDILAQLRIGKWKDSSNAAKTLREYVKGLHGNTTLNVINQILETLNDDEWVIRWTGVETLGWVGNIHVVPHLIQRLTDSNWKVKIAAVRALVEIKDTKAIIAISKLITDTNPLVREAAAEALGYLDGSQAISALESASTDTEEFVRLAAVESLGKIRNKVVTQTLISALKDSSEHVRWAAANALTGIADADLVLVLIPSLSDAAGPYWEQKRICDVIVDILKQIDTEEARLAITQWQANHA